MIKTKEELKKEIKKMVRLTNVKKDEMERLKTELGDLNHNINDNHKKLEHLKRYKEITVSDHAIIRWMERNHGTDFDKIRKEILTDKVLLNILAIKADGTYEKRVVRNGVVVTVLDFKN